MKLTTTVLATGAAVSLTAAVVGAARPWTRSVTTPAHCSPRNPSLCRPRRP